MVPFLKWGSELTQRPIVMQNVEKLEKRDVMEIDWAWTGM
jgi:hypothetical protein